MSPDRALAEFISGEPPERVHALIGALRSGNLSLASTRPGIEYAVVPGPRTVDRIQNVLESWQSLSDDASAAPLIAALEAAAELRSVIENRGPRCELVWTGPQGPHGVRTTDQVVVEMLGHCTRTALIVQYAVQISGGSLRVLEGLAALAKEGVILTVLVDARWNDGRSITQIKRHWPKDAPRPRLWSFTHEEDEIAKLHAKVLIVDQRDMLVTSANLTGYGYSGNLEFGVRVRGDPALQAADHFDALIRSGTLERVDW